MPSAMPRSARARFPHLSVELLDQRSGARMAHVPYKGAAEALPALIGNQVQVYADTISSSLPYIKNGNLRALAVTSKRRSSRGSARITALPSLRPA